MNANMLYENIPAIAGLNKVAGFDPRRFLRKMISFRTKEEIFDIDLKYKKLWFRLVHQGGRLKVTALKITEQLAIIEAKVFFGKDDSEPAASFIAHTSKAEDGPRYIEYAQYAASDEALSDAGFGCQFNDVRKGKAPEFADKVMTPATESARVTAPAPMPPVEMETKEAPPVPQSEQQPRNSEPAETKTAPLVETIQSVTEPDATEPDETADQPQEEPAAAPADAETKAVPDTTTIPDAEVAPESVAPATPQGNDDFEEIVDEEDMPEENADQPSRFTKDMPVEEICALMTLEEAAAVIVDIGYCNDWTLGRVAEERPASLKWYLNGYNGDNNIMRAGARILLESKTERAAA